MKSSSGECETLDKFDQKSLILPHISMCAVDKSVWAWHTDEKYAATEQSGLRDEW